jgi:hypothetical protein
MIDKKKEEVKENLMQTRAGLTAVLQGLNEADWEMVIQSEGAHWTVSDIMRHLISAEKGMIGLMEQFQQGNDPVPPDFDRDRYNARSVEKTKNLTPAEMMAAMESNRAHLLQFIDTLQPDDWQKKGRHANLTIMTIEEVCTIIAAHEFLHTGEIQKALRNQGTSTE